MYLPLHDISVLIMSGDWRLPKYVVDLVSTAYQICPTEMQLTVFWGRGGGGFHGLFAIHSVANFSCQELETTMPVCSQTLITISSFSNKLTNQFKNELTILSLYDRVILRPYLIQFY